MDFLISKYAILLKSLQSAGFFYKTFENFIENPVKEKCIILRHDVDRNPQNALIMAKIERSLGIKTTYYFRIVTGVWNEKIMKEIVTLGHEVAYHYEDFTIGEGNFEKAINHFETQLSRFRKIYPLKTICMHGSPMSKWDNRKLWEKYDYHDYGIIAEPYFDVDFNEVFYITDASRSWNNEKVSIRDKVETNFNISIKSTQDIIDIVNNGEMPGQVMINIHPHNWAVNNLEWLKIFMWQGMKNTVKRVIIKSKKKSK